MRKGNVPLLMVSGALGMMGGPIMVLLGGILGAELAPTPGLATLPNSMLVVGLAAATLPAAQLTRRVGRRGVVLIGAMVGLLSALVAMWALSSRSFWLLCVAGLILGVSGVAQQQYRFAAAESVEKEKAGQAVSLVLVGGIAAGFLGPRLATLSRDWLPAAPFSGSFLALSAIYIIVFLMLALFFREPEVGAELLQANGRQIGEIARQPVFLLAVGSAAVGYGVMTFIMTATPLQMVKLSGFAVEEATLIIQWHIMAMFAPSLISGLLIERLGVQRVLAFGLISLLGTVGLGVISRHLLHYWGALVLLGVGWNFLFVGGTVLLTQSYRPEERFKTQATNDFVVFTMQVLASFSAGSVLLMANWEVLNLLNVPVLAAFLVLILSMRKFVRAVG